jgi:hypothetical protein
VLAISTFAVLTVAVSFVSFKLPLVRPYLDGEPLIIVQDGQLVEPNPRRERLTREEGRRGSAPAADRVAGRRPVGGAGGEREYELHSEAVLLDSPAWRSTCPNRTSTRC